MLCQNCHKQNATVRVTEILDGDGAPGGSSAAKQIQERHLCEVCVKALDLPYAPPVKKGPINILQMIHSAARSQRRALPTCKSCGMDLEEFRRRGRLGCPACYEAFRGPIGELLERVHGARRHVGRVPGVSEDELRRLQGLAELRQELERAIRNEAYETAARLRDEIATLESSAQGAPGGAARPGEAG